MAYSPRIIETPTTSNTVAQTAHGFVVGDILTVTFASPGVLYIKAQADSSANAEVVGIVSQVINLNNFVIATSGRITLSGLSAGSGYYLSTTVAGTATTTEPTAINTVSKPVYIALSQTEALLTNFRGSVITSNSSITLQDARYMSIIY